MKRSLLFLVLSWSFAAGADFLSSFAAYERGDYASALHEFKPLAEQGHAESQFLLGQMHNFGRGVPQDDTQALMWYRKAADQGLADAQYWLGILYQLGDVYPLFLGEWFNGNEEALNTAGRNIPEDKSEGIKWLLKAAEQGHLSAQYGLGAAYQSGQGVPIDYVRAYMWYEIMDSSNNPTYQEMANIRSMFVKKMTPEEVSEARRLADEWIAEHNKAQ